MKIKPLLITIAVALLVITVIYFWKDSQAKKQTSTIEKLANEKLTANNEEWLKALAKPLIWSIRSEMLRGNLEQVNIFTSDMVKEKNFQFIHIIDPDEKIINSTDKKLEGQSATGMFDSALLKTDSVLILKKDNIITLSAPIMGYDKRLAVLILNYAADKFIPLRENE